MVTHWTEKLFIEVPDLFRSTIEARFEKTQDEITGLEILLKNFGVPENGLILDLACGIGRVSIPLAKMGYNVVGIDISPSYIKRAIKYAEKDGVSEKTRFIIGDMRKVTQLLSEYSNRFDAIINMWTSMGYWDEETDLNILNQSKSLTKPSGIFILHIANRDGIIKRFKPRDFSTGKNDLVILMERELDLETSRMINYWTYYRKKGKDMHYVDKMEINHRVYSLHELKKKFHVAGWNYLASYGGFDQQPLNTETFSMIIVSQK